MKPTAEMKKLKECLADCVSLIRGEVSGSVQRDAILREASELLRGDPSEPENYDTISVAAVAEDANWKQRAEEWMRIADAEASKSAAEFKIQIDALRKEVKFWRQRYERLAATSLADQ